MAPLKNEGPVWQWTKGICNCILGESEWVKYLVWVHVVTWLTLTDRARKRSCMLADSTTTKTRTPSTSDSNEKYTSLKMTLAHMKTTTQRMLSRWDNVKCCFHVTSLNAGLGVLLIPIIFLSILTVVYILWAEPRTPCRPRPVTCIVNVTLRAEHWSLHCALGIIYWGVLRYCQDSDIWCFWTLMCYFICENNEPRSWVQCSFYCKNILWYRT